METVTIQNVFAKPTGDVFVAGTPIATDWAEGLERLAVKSYEIGQIGEARYLLRVKRREEFIGHSLQKGGLSVQYFRDGEGNIIGRYGDGTTKIENRLAKGVHTNRGEVVDVGDAFVAVRVATGEVVLQRKDGCEPLADDPREQALMAEARNALCEIQKSVEAGQGKAHEEGGRKGIPILRLLKGLNFMPQADTQPHNEGETRSFGPNDTRTLMRAKAGELRWMDADERQKELQRRSGEAQAQSNTKPPTGGEGEAKQKPQTQVTTPPKAVHVGDVTVGGAKVIDHADNIVAVKKPDGTTGTMRREDVDKKQSKEEQMIAMARESKSKAGKERREKDYGKVADEHMQERQAAEDRKFDPDRAAIGETYMREAEAIRQEAKGTPEFQAFQKTVEGWHNGGGLSFEQSFKENIGDDVTRTRTMRKTWNPQTKQAMFELDDRSLRVMFDGK